MINLNPFKNKEISKKQEIKNKILELSKRCRGMEKIDNEENTKMSLILPLLSILGYDIHNENEVKAEYSADVGIKKGEKVDYALILDGKPKILIEAKKMGTDLDGAISQLYRYFSVTDAKVGIVTDGITYMFYTDNKRINVMDLEPYLYLNMRKITEVDIEKLLEYSKDNFHDEIVKKHVMHHEIKSIVSRIIGGLLDYDVDELVLKVIEDKTGIKGIEPDYINALIKEEINEIIAYNEKILKAIKTTEKIKNIPKEKLEESKLIKRLGGNSGELNIGEARVYKKKIEYAIIFGNKYENISYANLLTEVLNGIYSHDKSLIGQLLEDVSFKTGKYSKITRNIDLTRKPRELHCGGIYVETHMGAPDIIKLILQILTKCNIDYSNIKIKLIEE